MPLSCVLATLKARAELTSGKNTNKHIRLTQDRQSQSGWLWSRMPLTLPNWQIDVEFKVRTRGGLWAGEETLHDACCTGVCVDVGGWSGVEDGG